MNVIRLLEIVTGFVAILFVVTQIIVPLVMGRPTFGLFRRSAELEKQLAAERERTDETVLEKEIRQERQRRQSTKGKQ